MTSKFKILELVDSRSLGSEIEIGNVYKGQLDSSGQRVYYTDKTGDEWVFYVNDTCELL